jgi:hypothetical protein
VQTRTAHNVERAATTEVRLSRAGAPMQRSHARIGRQNYREINSNSSLSFSYTLLSYPRVLPHGPVYKAQGAPLQNDRAPHVQPLGQLDLPDCFGTPSNFRRETLTFELVGFRGTYHAVLGRPCYAKFMVVPNYTYLKLKMPGPNGVITVGPTYRHAYECDVECVEYAEALAESEALIADLESLSKEAPDVKRHAGNFEPAETVKSVPLDPSNDASKQIRIGSELDPK